MNRIDRLFATLLILQQNRTTAQALADQFEISKRTVYRDVAALSEMGVPVVSLPGEGYELMEGYYLPPLIFTANEATALYLGAKMLTQHAAGTLIDHAQQAWAKIDVALPKQTRQQAVNLTNIIEFITPAERLNLDDKSLIILQQAIQQYHVIHLTYYNYQQDLSERDIEPYALSYADDAWYVTGYCRLRQDIRTFRLSRIETLKAVDQTFTPREKVLEADSIRNLTVQIKFSGNIIHRVREQQHYSFEGERPVQDSDKVIMTYRLSRADELRAWLLSWGAEAEIIAPETFRQAIRAEVKKMLDMLT